MSQGKELSQPGLHHRDAWLDLWRGIAVLVMLETHCVNLFGREMDGQESWMGWLNFINGLAAPSFLWIAGYLQGKSVLKALATGRKIITKSRLARLGKVFLLGLFLQIPWDAMFEWKWSMTDWISLFQYNILPCMAVSLVLLILLGQITKRYFSWAGFLLALAVILLAPEAKHWESGFLPMDQWLNHDGGSLFPLFPWFGFCAIGMVMSRWSFSYWWIPIAFVMMAGGQMFQRGDFQIEHPGFFAERLGWVLLIGSLAKLLSKLNHSQACSGVQLMGRESLFVYVWHLLILFALPLAGGRTLQQVCEQRLSWPETMIAVSGVTLICLIFTWAYEQMKLHWKELRVVALEMTAAKAE